MAKKQEDSRSRAVPLGERDLDGVSGGSLNSNKITKGKADPAGGDKNVTMGGGSPSI